MAKYIFTIPQMAKDLNIDETTIHRRIKKLAIQGRKPRKGKGLRYAEEHFKRIGRIKDFPEHDNIAIIFEKYNIFAIIPSKMNYLNKL